MGHNIWVGPHNGKWGVRVEGNERPSRVVATQEEAIKIAKPMAQAEHSELIICRPDGTIREKESYGKDPFPPRG